MDEDGYVNYFQTTEPQAELLGDIEPGEVRHLTESWMLEERRRWVEEHATYIENMQVLAGFGLMYRPPDMVNLRRLLPGLNGTMAGPEEIAHRIFFAVAKYPEFQLRLAGKYGGPEYFQEMAEGLNSDELLHCTGQYYVRKAMHADVLERLRDLYRGRQFTDADRFQLMFSTIVKTVIGVNLGLLMSGDCVLIVRFFEDVLMPGLVQFLSNGYHLKQVVRSAFDEMIPWGRLTAKLPLAAYSCLLPDQNGNIPEWMMGARSPLFDAIGLPFGIEHFTLYSCLIADLPLLESGIARSLREVVNKYDERHDFMPSVSRFPRWVNLLANLRTEADEDMIVKISLQ